MGYAVLPGEPPVEIVLRRSARARRISLRVSALDGRVTLSVPKGIADADALAFAREKNDWIRKHLDKHIAPMRIEIGGQVLVAGQQLKIVTGPVKTVQIDAITLVVPPAPNMVTARVKTFLKLAAKTQLHRASHLYADRVGRKIGKITLRDTRSRWGSCTAQGNLMYSWRLAMAPPPVLDYVAAHEVAHLVELNHSAAYWAIVDRICPGYQAHRKWLRTHGGTLHQYRFDD